MQAIADFHAPNWGNDLSHLEDTFLPMNGDLNQFIINPKGMVPGTNMTFGGIQRPTERADLLVYLNSLSDNPAPLPKAAEAPGAPKAQ